MNAIALIVAAGRGSRFIAMHDVAKQYVKLCGMPILRHSVLKFSEHPDIDNVRVVIHRDDVELYNIATAGLDILPPVFGGDNRQESVRLGLESLACFNPKKVLIHDAARPCITKNIITSVIKELDSHTAAIPAIPVDDTLKKCSQGLVLWTLDRVDLWLAQTPQGFIYKDVMALHKAHQDKIFTDDSAVCEYSDVEVVVVPGSVNNIKITSDADYENAKSLMEMNTLYIGVENRVGIGFDVHKFTPKGSNGKLMLGGVHIEHDQTLIGHSDADVVLHVITDAIFGALSAGDVGSNFSDQDKQWKNSDSAIFLQHAVRLASISDASIVNVDVNILCRKPKIDPYRDAIKAKVAEIMNIEPERISIKAKSCNDIGAIGRGDGIMAQAIVLLSIKSSKLAYNED